MLRKMESVQGEGDVSEVFLVLGPPEEALEHRPRVPRERRALGLWRTMSLPSGAVWRRLVDLFGQIRGASFKCELRRWHVPRGAETTP